MADFLSQFLGDESTLKKSVLKHLVFLFNTRQGSLFHMPDYGLPDYDSITHGASSPHAFVSAIRVLVEKYEPRLTNLQVEVFPEKATDCLVTLRLEGALNHENRIRFSANLLSGGEVNVFAL